MDDQSQIDAMRAAVRGDLDRARARRAADPWRSDEPSAHPLQAVAEPAAEPEPEVMPEPEPEPVAEAEPVEEPQVEASVEREPEPEAEAEPEPAAESPRRGFFAALFRRD
jgi:hypothetical protein